VKRYYEKTIADCGAVAGDAPEGILGEWRLRVDLSN
jgi:hypothetical protein